LTLEFDQFQGTRYTRRKPIGVGNPNIQRPMKTETTPRKYRLGDMWSIDFDYKGMLKQLEEALSDKMSLGDMRLLYKSMEDVNYHTENRKLYAKIQEKREKGGL